MNLHARANRSGEPPAERRITVTKGADQHRRARPHRARPRRGAAALCHAPSAALVASLLLGAVLPSIASAQRPGRAAKAMLEVVGDRESYAPGDTVRLAARTVVVDGWHIQSNTPSFEYLIPTELMVALSDGLTAGEVYYPPHLMWQSAFEADPLAVYEGETTFLTTFAIPADFPGTEIVVSSVLAYQACDERVCLPPTEATHEMAVSVGTAGALQYEDLFATAQAALDGTAEGGGPGALGESRAAAPAAAPNLAVILLLGIVGGLILNAMPCVLPVLSLKVLSLVQSAGKSQGHVRVGALATASGILVSFWALALLVVLLRGAGQAVGWGIQFQNPTFVALLTLVVVFFSLNLWGLFEIPMPQALSGVGPGSGLAGHFATGLFATLMATPCSAPFLGTAVGFALSQPTSSTFAVFTAVGLGMSLPYLLLALQPSMASWLPKPGLWMDTLRGIMGFLLAGAAIWLLFVLQAQLAPSTLALLQASLLGLGLFAWLLHRTHQLGLTTSTPWRRVFSWAGMAVASLLVLALAHRADGSSRGTAEGTSRIAWVEFDRQAAEQRSADGELVFVDVTADWCATCKVNERVVLESDPVVAAFAKHQVVAMKADWTNRNDQIAEFLADYGRYAIPFYVLYRPGAEPHVFGELLTKGSVLEVLEESAAVQSTVAAR